MGPDHTMVSGVISRFQVSVLHEPSHVDMFPQTDTTNRYLLDDQFLSRQSVEHSHWSRFPEITCFY